MSVATNGSADVPQWDVGLDVMFGFLNLIVGVSSIIMNFLVFFVYLRLNWKHPTYFLFINITLHDAMSGFTGLYMGVFLFFNRPTEEDLAPGVFELCTFNGFLWSFTAFTTPTLLCIASAFRFMAIYMPYSYKDKVTFRNASIGVFIGWTVGLMSTLLPIFSKEKYTYNNKFSVCDVDITKGSVSVEAMVIFVLVPLLLPLCILVLCNAAVLVHLCKCTGGMNRDVDPSPAAAAGRGKRSVQNHGGNSNVNSPSQSEHKALDSQQHEQPLTAPSHHHSTSGKVPQFGAICEWKHKVARKDYHTATTVILMMLNYIICYGLWIVYFMDRAVGHGGGETEGTMLESNFSEKDKIYIDATIKLMACLNSALNGIVHIARGSQIRAQIHRLFNLIVSNGSENANQTGVTATLNAQLNSVTNNSKSR